MEGVDNGNIVPPFSPRFRNAKFFVIVLYTMYRYHVFVQNW